MLDNLRDEAHSFQDEGTPGYPSTPGTLSGPINGGGRRFLGMTPVQRFIIAFLFMLTVCVLGVMILFVTGKVAF